MLTAHTSEADIIFWILSSVDKNRKSCRFKKKKKTGSVLKISRKIRSTCSKNVGEFK